jgi:hypothetical protein
MPKVDDGQPSCSSCGAQGAIYEKVTRRHGTLRSGVGLLLLWVCTPLAMFSLGSALSLGIDGLRHRWAGREPGFWIFSVLLALVTIPLVLVGVRLTRKTRQRICGVCQAPQPRQSEAAIRP